MKNPNKSYVGAAIYFERLPDNEWHEDADASPGESAESPAIRSLGASREATGAGIATPRHSASLRRFTSPTAEK